MIEKLHNQDAAVAQNIYSVFQASYAVEAKLLDALNFPPLARPLQNYIDCTTVFYGYFLNAELAGVVEIDHNDEYTLIRSLVVHPLFFRQRIASKLIEFVFTTYHATLFIVETGLANEPAKYLYKKFGFIEVKQWDTEHGIRKIKFEKKITR